MHDPLFFILVLMMFIVAFKLICDTSQAMGIQPKLGGSAKKTSMQTSDKISKLEDDFPYKKKFMKEEDIITRFNNLKDYKIKFIEYKYKLLHLNKMSRLELLYLPDNKPIVAKFDKDDYFKYNEISDYFIEEERIHARRNKSNLTYYEFWHVNKSKFKADTIEKTRDNLYYSGFKEVNPFRPTIMAGLIDKFGAKCVLDPCSGWGDRLIGSLAKGVDHYVGTDPNTKLAPKYQEMINMLKSNTEAHMICAPFEEAELPNLPYDLVCTSPPYFDLEVYSDEPNQSINKFSSFDNWYTNFLMVMVKKAWSVLKEDGVMVLIINEYGGPVFIKRMINDINKMADSIYLGVVCYGDIKTHAISANQRIRDFSNYDKGNYQPMWMWRKHTLSKEFPIKISKTNVDGKELNVIADDNLIGGSKQRAHKMFANITQKEIIYAGPSTGCAQIALAFVAKMYGKYCTLFLREDTNELTLRARMLGANVIMGGAKIDDLKKRANEYYKKNPNKRYLCPFGLNNDEFKNCMQVNIEENLPSNLEIKNIWLVAGSATLLSVLYKVLPNTFFNVVQVGKTIWPDQLDQSRSKLYVAPELFFDEAKEQPSYDTISTYDAKLWQFAKEHANDGDYIWNVCGQNNELITSKYKLL